jgi:hypothetical protein
MITMETIVSWHSDKPVQDNIVESWLCVDCGVTPTRGTRTAASCGSRSR